VKKLCFALFLCPLILFSKENESIPSTELKPKVLIIAEINPVSFKWEDLGFKDEILLTNSLLHSWIKWVGEHQKMDRNLLAACEHDCKKFYEWIQSPIEDSQTETEEVHNPHWLKISYNVRKMYSDQKINEFRFEWEGNAILLDGKGKMIREAFRIYPETKAWRGLSQKELNSALATSIYRSGLDSISRIVRKIEDSSSLEKLKLSVVRRLTIKGHKQMIDVIKLMELIKNLGVGELELESFNATEAQLRCSYNGEEKMFMDLLSKLKELKSTNNYKVVNESDANHYILKLSLESY
jgi:hypothetical protein